MARRSTKHDARLDLRRVLRHRDALRRALEEGPTDRDTWQLELQLRVTDYIARRYADEAGEPDLDPVHVPRRRASDLDAFPFPESGTAVPPTSFELQWRGHVRSHLQDILRTRSEVADIVRDRAEADRVQTAAANSRAEGWVAGMWLLLCWGMLAVVTAFPAFLLAHAFLAWYLFGAPTRDIFIPVFMMAWGLLMVVFAAFIHAMNRLR